MKNLTFTLFFLSFFLSGNAQDYGTLKTTHEGHVLIENSNFQGFLSFDDNTTLHECSYQFFSTIQYNGNGNDKDFLLATPLFHVTSSNLIADKAGSSKIAILTYGRTYFSNIVSNANLNICKYSHRDGSIIPMLIPVSTTSQPDYHNIHLIDFPNGDWGIVGSYRNGDFSFPGMTTPFVESNGQFKNFIIKFNGTTNQVVWQQEFVASTNLKPYTDTNGNLYLFGKRASNTFATLGGLTLGVDTSVNITDNFYLAKINAQGVPLLLKSILKTDTPIEVEFHLQDSAYYIVSQVDGQVIFDSSTVFNGNGSFIAKYNTSNDSLTWLRDAPISIEHSVLDLQNNIYFIGNSSNINWTLDSTHFYNEIKFFGKINEAGMTTAVTFDTLSNVNTFGMVSNRKQLVVTSENKVCMLVGKMEYADELLFIEISPMCEIEIIDFIEYSACFISTEEEDLTTTIQIAPNPTTDFIHISIKDENNLGDVLYRLYNVNGQLLKKGNINNQTKSINIQSLPSGLYFTEIITEKGSVTKKVVKL